MQNIPLLTTHKITMVLETQKVNDILYSNAAKVLRYPLSKASRDEYSP